jgi:hypothetical protein
MQNLELKSAAGLSAVVLPVELASVSLEAPAVEVMADFTHQPPALIPAATSADEVLRWLSAEKFPWHLVVGTEQEIVGLLVRGGGAEQAMMRCIAAGQDRHSLTANDLMIPLPQLHTLNFKQLASARVSDLLVNLKQQGARYCLILQGDQHHIRGLICAQDIAKRIGMEWDFQRTAPTFVDIFTAIHP